jgi:hypothetical protein
MRYVPQAVSVDGSLTGYENLLNRFRRAGQPGIKLNQS